MKSDKLGGKKRYEVTVNGRQYIVEVEEIAETGQPDAPATAPVSAPQSTPQPAPAAAPAAAPAPVAQGVAEGYAVKAPLRGQIVRVAVKPGDTVARGQLICSIEALKLENEISAPVAGRVTGVFVKAGASVDTGTVLATIRETA